MRKSQRAVTHPHQKQKPAPFCGFPRTGGLHQNLLQPGRIPVGPAPIRLAGLSGKPRIRPIFPQLHNAPGGQENGPAPPGNRAEFPPGLCPVRRSPDYLVILATTPEPTVRPPSRIAKRRPSSMAIGAISLTPIFTLSPGMTISVPSGRITSPVTSVVRK